MTATDGHPFWIPELGEWADATNLAAGERLSSSTRVVVRITEVRRWDQSATVYNLTVADVHTYYVLAGATPVLVHNSDCPTTPVAGGVRTSAILRQMSRQQSRGAITPDMRLTGCRSAVSCRR
ncbi:polymorphic toxin-type HINT domain-containing protein [Streptomyces sp. NPDC002740]